MSDLLKLQVAELTNKIGQLPASKHEFAQSLCDQFWGRRRPLSERQAFWVAKLLEIAENPAAAERPTVAVGSMAGVIALFDKARERAKSSPSIVLAIKTENGYRDFRLWIAGERARVPGSINVGSADRQDWYGRIYRDGRFEASPRIATPAGLVELLERFAREPAKVATECGILMSRCCFCRTELTDQERSAKIGIGPHCARKWGLYDEWKAAKKLAAFETGHEGCGHDQAHQHAA